MKEIGFRSEDVFGEGYRYAPRVMAHEVFELENSDIIDTLSSNLMRGSKILKEAHNITDEESGVLFFKEVLKELSKITGREVKYCLWLCDKPEDVFKEYGASKDSIKVYLKSDIVLSDLGNEGKLYGYEELPKPLADVFTVEQSNSFGR